MSIIITGLKMPTERESFNLTIKYNGTVLDTEMGMQVAEAHELPPHGRLIDGDALDAYLKTVAIMADGEAKEAYIDTRAEARTMPVIIPAEEGE